MTKALKLLEEKFEEDSGAFSVLTNTLMDDPKDEGQMEAEDLVVSKVKDEKNKSYLHMNEIYEEAKTEGDTEALPLVGEDETKVQNSFYNGGFAHNILRYWVRFTPLWSAMFNAPGDHRFSNDPLENFFELLKLGVLDRLGPFKVNQFVRKENSRIKHLHLRITHNIRSRRMVLVRGTAGVGSTHACEGARAPAAKRKKIETQHPSLMKVLETCDVSDEPDDRLMFLWLKLVKRKRLMLSF